MTAHPFLMNMDDGENPAPPRPTCRVSPSAFGAGLPTGDGPNPHPE